MKTRLLFVMAAVVMLASVISAGSLPGSDPQSQFEAAQALKDLKQAYPGVQAYKSDIGLTRLYGTWFGSGPTPLAAAERFVFEHADVWGLSSDEIVPGSPRDHQMTSVPVMYDETTGRYKFTLFYYHQEKDGMPVYESELRVLVRNDIDNKVVLAVSTLRDLGDFVSDVGLAGPSFDMAEQVVRADEPTLDAFLKHRAVIFAGHADELATPTMGLNLVAKSDFPSEFEYVVDARTGEILYKEDLIIFEDVVGNVAGLATQGPGAEQCEQELSEPCPWARVNIGGTYAYTDANGDFVIPNGGSSDVTVTSELRGTWFRVYNNAGSESVLNQTVTPPGPASFTHNSSNTEYVRSQVNAYIEANGIRDLAIQANPSYPSVSTETQFPVTVNRSDGYCPGNAWYSPTEQSINFCASGSSYPNTAWSSVIVHEYGHRLVNAAGSGQGQYGEGFGDCMSVLTLDSPLLGLGFYGDCNTSLRTADNNHQYPCTGAIHDCGQLLSGCVWDTRNELVVTEPIDYLDILADLTINSCLLHTGDLITPQITIDFMTLDDDDGNLANGSPHYYEIQAGFSAHNMPGPELALLVFDYPNGLPSLLTPGSSTDIEVVVSGQEGSPVSGTGEFHYAVDGGSYSSVPMTETTPNNYIATIPALDCFQKVDFYFSAEDVGGATVNDPSPGNPYHAMVATDAVVAYSDDFESNQGWTFSGGNWAVGTPTGGGGSYGNPDPSGGHSGSGVLGYNLNGDYENNMPERHATSPAIDCSDLVGATLNFWRWLGVEQPSYDHAYIRISTNGSSWTTIWENTSEVTDAAWTQKSYDIAALADGEPTVYVRFTMGTTDWGWTYCGWNVDDLEIVGYECNENRPIITTTTLPDWTQGLAYSEQLEAISGTPPYDWTDKNGDLSGTGLSLSPGGLLTGTPATAGTISFTARVVDQNSEADEETFSFEIAPAVQITTLSLPDWTAGHAFSEQIEATGGTGAVAITDQNSDLAGTGLALAPDGLLSGTPVEGTVSFTALATDQVGATDDQAFNFTVNPALTITTTSVPDAIKDVYYEQQMNRTGGTGSVVWIDKNSDLSGTGLTLSSSGLISGTAVDTGLITFTAQVSDDVGAVDEQIIDLMIQDILHITTEHVPDWTVGHAFSYQLVAVGAQGQMTWSDLNADLAGTGLGLSTDGLLSGTPTVEGEITFTAMVVDEAKHADQKEFTFTINPSIVITTTTLPDWTIGVAYSQQLEATGGTRNLTWSDQGEDLNGTGLALTPLGVVSGTPTAEGPISFTAVATDKVGAYGAHTFDFTINSLPTVVSETLPDATQSGYYEALVETAGGTGVITVTDKYGDLVGTGLSLASDGTLSGTPIDSGMISFTAHVADEIGASGQKSLTVYVNPALQIITDNLPAWTAGVAFSYLLESTPGSGEVTWSDLGDDLSGTGLSLAADGLLSGTPSSAGTIEFTAVVSDEGGGYDEKLLSMTVNPVVQITTAELPAWTVNCAYSQALSAAGGTGPISFTDLGGDLDGTGLALNASGQISGAPSASGEIGFTAHAEDMVGGYDDRPLTIMINPAVAITTVALPDGVEGEAYSEQLTMAGGTGPFTWVDFDDGLAGTGISLTSDGLLTGTPNAVMTVNFTAQVTDMCGSSDQAALSFEVGPSWICGDIDGNGEGPDIADVVYLTSWMFASGPEPPNLAAVNVDGQGGAGDIADLVYLVAYMFSEGPDPDCQGTGAVWAPDVSIPR